jgi:hypothetical protein
MVYWLLEAPVPSPWSQATQSDAPGGEAMTYYNTITDATSYSHPLDVWIKVRERKRERGRGGGGEREKEREREREKS